MRKYIISILIIIISVFFINSKANFKYDVNYLAANRHINKMVSTDVENKDEYIHKYIISEVKNYDVEIEEDNDYIIVKKQSSNSNAKTIGFISHYNVFDKKNDVNNSALSTSSMLESIQAYNNHQTNNNLVFIFSKNNNSSLNGNIEFLKNHNELYKNIDYLFSLDSRGVSGELYIYNSSPINSDIISFYKNSVTSASGFSDFAINHNNIDLEETQVISLALLNDDNTYFLSTNTLNDLDENSRNIYINTVNELVKNAHDYNFDGLNNSVVYFNYLDSFISINFNIMLIMLAISLIGMVLYIIIHKNILNSKNIFMYTLLTFSIFIFALINILVPFSELAYLLQKIGIKDITNKIYFTLTIIFILYGIFIHHIAKKHYPLSNTEVVATSYLSTISFMLITTIFTGTTNIALVIILLLFSLMLWIVHYSKNNISIYIFMLAAIPIIVYNLYFIYSITTLETITYFIIMLAINVTITLPIFSIKLKH